MLAFLLTALAAAAVVGLALLLLGLAASTLDPEARERARSKRGESTIDDILARDAALAREARQRELNELRHAKRLDRINSL
jgi:L-cystine uptake protein TcyP (sodium:dicarboxylate symporter family)